MTSFENPEASVPEGGTERPRALTREDVEGLLARGENLEGFRLTDVDLAGLTLEGKSFRGSDIRGLKFYRVVRDREGHIIEEVTTNARECDLTDALVADYGGGVSMELVDAEGARFGFSEDLRVRRERHAAQQAKGEMPTIEDSGGYLSFVGSGGNFRRTTWLNVDFGGQTGYEAIFDYADLEAAIMQNCDLSGIDFSTANLEGIAIRDPVSLLDMTINEQ